MLYERILLCLIIFIEFYLFMNIKPLAVNGMSVSMIIKPLAVKGLSGSMITNQGAGMTARVCQT